MDQPTKKVNCPEHGLRNISFVCVHIAMAIDSAEQVGFFWSEAENNLLPIAWCSACEKWLLENGEEWNEAFKQQAEFKLLCEGCFSLAKKVLYEGNLGHSSNN